MHAELTRQIGIDAFDQMCFLTHGRFKFEPEFHSAQQTMSENGMEILLESARRRDELEREKRHSRLTLAKQTRTQARDRDGWSSIRETCRARGGRREVR